jgi:hypothetical protein
LERVAAPRRFERIALPRRLERTVLSRCLERIALIEEILLAGRRFGGAAAAGRLGKELIPFPTRTERGYHSDFSQTKNWDLREFL